MSVGEINPIVLKICNWLDVKSKKPTKEQQSVATALESLRENDFNVTIKKDLKSLFNDKIYPEKQFETTLEAPCSHRDCVYLTTNNNIPTGHGPNPYLSVKDMLKQIEGGQALINYQGDNTITVPKFEIIG